MQLLNTKVIQKMPSDKGSFCPMTPIALICLPSDALLSPGTYAATVQDAKHMDQSSASLFWGAVRQAAFYADRRAKPAQTWPCLSQENCSTVRAYDFPTSAERIFLRVFA